MNRDINPAINMIIYGEKTPKNLPEDFWKVTPVEKESLYADIGKQSIYPGKLYLVEAGSPQF